MIVGVARTPRRTGPTLDLLPKYAFAIGPNTTEKTPHYPGIRRITNLDGINDESFTIEQFGDVRIDEVSVRNASGGFSQSGFTFDNSSISFDNGENYFIPEAAFNTQINVPPPGMIIISGSGRINAFDNTFITFDSGTERFDETTVTTLMSDTTKKFDSSTIKFDGSGGDITPRDVAGEYVTDFSESGITFDSSINKFDEGTRTSGSSIPRFDDGVNTFDKNNLKFDNAGIIRKFSSGTVKFDSTNNTFDLG